ncbi:MAG: 4-hydroxybenzoate polyprenyltransferase [Dehalococcoidia bacterium]|nr:4-hydroxybenzoate polyprenyltransferase [Dehalococcoidia bacterium]
MSWAWTSAEKVRAHLENIKVEHSLFALPFGYTGMVLATGGLPTAHHLLWITVALVAARSYAFCMNRLIDYPLDSIDPRTASRPLPAGRLHRGEVVAVAIATVLVVLYSAWQLNPLCVLLSPIALVVLTFYTYLKRVTWLYHYSIGLAGSGAPIGAWIGVRGELSWEPVILGVAVIFWWGGFDIIQDITGTEFDSSHGLHSVPVRFGPARALTISAISHGVTIVLFIWLGLLIGLKWPYWIGMLITAGLLVFEHSLVTPEDLSRTNLAFFYVNALISATFLVFTTISLLV